MFSERLPEFLAAHTMLVGIAVALVIALVATEAGRLMRKYKALSPAGLTGLINRDNALVIDVSALNDYQAGHIVGSKHVAMSQFDPEAKDLAKLRDLPIAVVDKLGQQSAQACERLAKAGYSKVYWLEGGIAAWQSAGLPLTKGR